MFPGIYGRTLMSKGQGIPLWLPGGVGLIAVPGTLYKMKGLRVGDVGLMLEDGTLLPFFNMRAPVVGHKLSSDVIVVEPEFHPPGVFLSYGVEDIRNEVKGNTRVVTTEYSESSRLLLPQGAARIEAPKEIFREIIFYGALDWYHFLDVTDQGDHENGQLYVVTGVDKAHQWANETFKHCTSVKSSPVVDAGLSAYRKSSEESRGMVSTTQAQRDDDDEIFSIDAPDGRNQTVFMRGYHVWVFKYNYFLTTGLWRTIQSTWKWLFRKKVQVDVDKEEILVSIRGRPSIWLKEWVLDHAPNADVIAIHDDDWCAAIYKDEYPLPDRVTFRKRLPGLLEVKVDTVHTAGFGKRKCAYVVRRKDKLGQTMTLMKPEKSESEDSLRQQAPPPPTFSLIY
ncbi:hypothetical protein AX16_001114 [Volvariella volvacea WC 439]|nr:hypothetical protein AX16_001114 [Volvariella volvacea WC 439]